MKIYTSESVSIGHPDKVADQISDALLDEFLKQDPKSRVAVETMLAHGVAVVSGEVTTNAYVNVQEVVRDTIKSIGYTNTAVGFDGDNCGVLVAIQGQSNDIAMGVDTGGAGDQGMMFGYATNETKELMPLPIAIAHAIMRKAVEVRRSSPGLGLRPDAKSQVSVIYDNEGIPKTIDTVVVSHQHDDHDALGNEIPQEEIRNRVRQSIIEPVLAEYEEYRNSDITFHINPTGRFVTGGPAGDTGLTGRKIIVDTYGGMAPHGGGAFSGKDPTKVDRSAAYVSRFLAKNIVAAGLASRCVVQLAYAIGVAQPVAINLETFGTETEDPDVVVKRIKDNFDLSPAGIIKTLNLLETKYLPTAKNGHFGNPVFPWESTSAASLLK
ncbi:MAG: methionine adenosyltransferase [Armatimonadetes bacterium]|nr:methionine adenosyltransferase [Armatimonadota bacterium]MBS1704174.1 methionine adenosyltransferase [Armatimonadota bacterium]MBS1726970.1 methionine adenosyltransferase [Armatimonadota bacterium]